ncbi:hypothetical protein MUN82_17770 [Hymenobacter aerilatus]|uniref:Glycosyltransferase RgtA/B/C/D-like domain-containing protein n=1 Tax=Hymenobacter aerilatus TaxID=2932251 RepID=A0A8T9STW3_9BACT|nr:hypothetical protein [Hymenobacter aerilatus]UOR04781.1 hypothetical protein MUN82_17770 [Hymenobacter aerilatus]
MHSFLTRWSNSPWFERIVVGLFFGLLLLLGLYVYRDYGVSWDEPVDRDNGAVNLKYVLERVAPQLIHQQRTTYASIPPLTNYPDNDHGVAFELPLAVLGVLVARGDSAAYYHLRHLSIFCVFWVGCWALYGLARHYFGSWLWALFAVGLLVLSPRFFAEAFFNGKDIVFMACFIVAMFTLARLLVCATVIRATLHALATAVAIDVRVPGLLIVGFTVALLAWQLLLRPSKRLLSLGLLYVLLTTVFMVIGWPFLWDAPIANFLWSYQHLSHYPWQGQNLYFGQLIDSQVPWHYLPVWILITTPTPYLLAALLGVAVSGRRLARQRFAQIELVGYLTLLVVSWLLVPVVLVIILRSRFYDGWRHLYFIYPALVLVAVQGIRWLVQATRRPHPARYLALGVLLLSAVETMRTAIRMVQMHPFQQVYFSFIPAQMAERLFERDYWGLSYYQGLQWLLRHHHSAELLSVSAPVVTPVVANSLLFTTSKQARLAIHREPQKGRFFITNYRWHPQPYADSLGQEIYSIRAEGITILSIFDREASPTRSAP